MFKRVKQLMLVALCCVSCAPMPKVATKEPRTHAHSQERWVVYYGNTEPAESFVEYDVVLFDRIYHPPIEPLLQDPDRILLAYISAGEVHGYRSDEIALLKSKNAILADNTDWGSHMVDMTSAEWRSIVMGEITDALNQGFHGVMLDTIEMPMIAAARRSPELAEANRQATIQLIADIRQTYPDIYIMLNRGFPILPEVSSQLDFILAESILAETNVSTGQSKLFPPKTYREMTTMLQDARLRSPELKIFTLDYWNTDDVDGIERLYAIHRDHGFIPYVTSLDLRVYSREPHSKWNNTRATGTKPVAIGREDNDA